MRHPNWRALHTLMLSRGRFRIPSRPLSIPTHVSGVGVGQVPGGSEQVASIDTMARVETIVKTSTKAKAFMITALMVDKISF